MARSPLRADEGPLSRLLKPHWCPIPLQALHRCVMARSHQRWEAAYKLLVVNPTTTLPLPGLNFNNTLHTGIGLRPTAVKPTSRVRPSLSTISWAGFDVIKVVWSIVHYERCTSVIHLLTWSVPYKGTVHLSLVQIQILVNCREL